MCLLYDYGFDELSSNNYAIQDGTSGSSITDGGNDMYDGGNQITVKLGSTWTEDLSYTQSEYGTQTTYSDQLSYYTYKRTGPTVFFAEFESQSSSLEACSTVCDVSFMLCL